MSGEEPLKEQKKLRALPLLSPNPFLKYLFSSASLALEGFLVL
jgi:hypothetical protein